MALSWHTWIVNTIVTFLPIKWLLGFGTPEGFAAGVRKEAAKPPAEAPADVKKKVAVALLEGAACRTHVLSPLDGASPSVTFVFFHGGAYVFNLWPQHFQGASQLMAELGCAAKVVIPEYPLAPATTHEMLVAVAEKVYRQAAADAAPGKVVLMGDSAGGGLALIVAQVAAHLCTGMLGVGVGWWISLFPSMIVSILRNSPFGKP